MNRCASLGIGVIASLLSLVSAGSGATEQPATPEDIRVRVEKSLVYLRFWRAGEGKGCELAGHGTGFVIIGPDKRKWIATTSHGFWTTDPKKKVVSVTYRLREEDFTWCETILIDEKHDLAMLSPNRLFPLDKAPALDWVPTDPKNNDPLMVVGSPSGLVFTPYSGYVRNKPITVEEMARQQEKKVSAFAPMAADLTFIQHDIPIAEGYSGSPVVSLRDGKVVGLQCSTLKDAAFVGFAVHRQHVSKFDWNMRPRDLKEPILVSVDTALARKSAPAVAFKTNPVVPEKPKELPPVKVKLGGIDVEAPFVHHGYIEKDARKVIEKYIEDKDWYLTEQFGGNRLKQLQDLLDRVPVARISNPLLGFQVLVPKGYRYSVQPTEKPNGLLVTFSPDGKAAAPYDWPLSIWVTIEPELFVKARADFSKLLSSGKFPLTDEEKKSPAAFATSRDRMVNAMVADVVDPRFAERDLGIRIRVDSKDGKPATYRGNPKAPIFTQLTSGEGRWLRSSYQSAKNDDELCHLVRLSGRDPRMFVVHFQYTKKNATAFNTGKGFLDPIHAEYALIASSVSAGSDGLESEKTTHRPIEWKPTFGSVKLKADFKPDPFTKELVAGGPIRTFKAGVKAYIANEPDFVLDYEAGKFELTIYAESKADTTLLIQAPDGKWFANDDGPGTGLNPLIRFENPKSGRYVIWVGTFGRETAKAELKITELKVGN